MDLYLAQTSGSEAPQEFTQLGGPQNLQEAFCIVQNGTNWLLSFAIIIGIIMIIWGGIQFMVSSSEPEKISQAKSIIIWTLVGVLVISLSWALISIVGNFVGANIGNSGLFQFINDQNCVSQTGGGFESPDDGSDGSSDFDNPSISV